MTLSLQAGARNLRGARGRAGKRRASSVFSPAQRPDSVVLPSTDRPTDRPTDWVWLPGFDLSGIFGRGRGRG